MKRKPSSAFDNLKTKRDPVQPAPPPPTQPATVSSIAPVAAAEPKKSRRDDIETALMRVTTKKRAHNQLKAVSGHIGLTLQDFAVTAINRLLMDLHTAPDLTLEAIDIDASPDSIELLQLLSNMQLTLPSKIGKDEADLDK